MKKVSRFLTHLSSSTGLWQISSSAVSDIIASLFGGLATIFISRQVGPADFGQFSTGFALTLILVRLNDLGLSTATSKFIGGARTKAERNKFFSLITKYRVILSLLIVVTGLAVLSFFNQALNIEQSQIMLWALIVSLATTYFEHLRFSLQALLRIKQANWVNLIQGSGKVLFALFLWLTASLPILIIFIIYMAIPIIPVLLSRYFYPQWLRVVGQHRQFKTQQHKLNLFLRHSAVEIASASLVENIDILFAAHFLADFQTGLLGGVARIATLLYILSYSVGNVLNPRVARYQKKSDLRQYLLKALGLLVLSGLGLAVSWFLAEYIIFYTIGQQYLAATRLFQLLLASGFVSLALMPFRALFYLFEADWYFSVTGIVQVLIVVLGGWWLTPIYGLLGLAAVRLVARGVLFLLTLSGGLWLYARRK